MPAGPGQIAVSPEVIPSTDDRPDPSTQDRPDDRPPEGSPPTPRHARASRRPRSAGLLVALIVLQLGTIVVFGAITAARYPLWSPVDEGAHFDNVAWIAEHGSLPVLGQTPASEQQLAIRQGVYPRRTNLDPAKLGLTGLSYEAFQPPLYYVVATPVFDLSGNYRTKAYLLRFFGLALLVAAAALVGRLSRHVLKDRWLVGWSVGLLVLMMPGVVVRSVTISNLDLAIPLTIACVTEIWIAWERRSSMRLVAAGALVGLCVLTDLYLVELVPVFALAAVAVVRSRRTWTDALWAGAGALVAFLAVVPWLVFNEIHYHALTASQIAKREQLAVVNPGHLHYSLGAVPGLTVQNLFNPLMPQEWGTVLWPHPVLDQLAVDFQVLLIGGTLVLALALGRRLVDTGYWILFLPWVLNLFLCWYIDVGQQWLTGSMVARYTYPTLPVLGVFVGAAALHLLRTPRVVVVGAAASTLFLVWLWISLVPTLHAA